MEKCTAMNYQSRNSTNIPVTTNAKNKIAPSITMYIARRWFAAFGIDMPRNEMNIQKAERWGSFAGSGSCEGSIGDELPMKIGYR